MKSPFHVMIIPTLGCPSKCHYCWSSDERSPVMSIKTVREIAEWLKDYQSNQVTITFHGGEPLLAGADFYRQALPTLSEGLAHLEPTFALQSNLWLLTPEMARIFAEYNIPIGSSIDGPEEINDTQRGKGYYQKTMRGYEIAKANGLEVRFICTFTCRSVEGKEEIFNFFLENGFPLKLHPALPSLRSDDPKEWALEPEAYGELLVYLLDKYLENLSKIEVMNINDLCRCIFTRHGTVCTFVDCMGTTLAFGPDGSIYPCYRFVGMPEYAMGNVYDRPTAEDLAQSDAWKLMHAFKEFVDRECAGCPHIKYCRGGCPYNAITPTDGEIQGVDPHCIAYKRIFDEITNRLNEEMFGSGDTEMEEFGSPLQRTAKPGIMAILRAMATK
ncbi:Anaerobic sulfatase-maturating enzyme [anaerobic digester metagenome]